MNLSPRFAVILIALGLGCSRARPPETAPTPAPPSDTDRELFPNPVDRTEVRMGAVRRLIDLHLARTGALPGSLDDVLPREPKSQWVIDYEHDAWEHRFRYRRAGTDYELTSCGPDGQCGTADDITVTRYRGTRWDEPSAP